jgi:hypothetical protein
MDGGVEIAVHHADGLVTLFAVYKAMRSHNDVVVIIEYEFAKLQPQPVLETVGFIFCRIEFKLHAVDYVNHT